MVTGWYMVWGMTRFHMTEGRNLPIRLWPGGVVPIPPVIRRPAWLDNRGLLQFGAQDEYRELPDELVLRGLFGLDAEDPAAVVEFIDRHGVIDLPFDDLGALLPQTRATLLDFRAEAGARPARDEDFASGDDGAADVHWYDAALYLRRVRALVKHLEEWYDLAWDGLSAPWAEEGFSVGAVTRPDHLDMAWGQFVVALNAGTKNYRVRVEYDTASVPGFMFGRPEAGLHSALCLQVQNVIARDDIPLRRCANEPCPHLFQKQIGGASYNQNHASGVIYCTPTCARAQASRHYRRNQRKRKAAGVSSRARTTPPAPTP